MKSLYFLSYNRLLILIIQLIMAVILQTYCTVYGFFSFRYEKKNLWITLQDGMIALYLLILVFCSADALHQMSEGFLLPRQNALVRYLVFFLMTVFSFAAAAGEENLGRLIAPVLTVLTLPAVEDMTGRVFPLQIFICCWYWIFRSVTHLYRYRKQRKEQLSAFSVKEAVDRMDFGLLLCKDSGISRGQILLCSRQMRGLMWKLLGQPVYSGTDFYEKLRKGWVLQGVEKENMDEFPIYRLENQVWRFEGQTFPVKNQRCFLITASNITPWYQANQKLEQHKQMLAQRNRELKTMLRDLDDIVKTEETIRAKSQVHDLLGQQISMILRSVREKKRPDPQLLASLSGGLTERLENASADAGLSLRSAAESFRSLGVSVEIQGEMPEDEQVKRVFYEIASEAMTNAVNHGLSTYILVAMEESGAGWKLRVENNGYVKAGPIHEGGGLGGMRRKTEGLGGSVSFLKNPRFTVLVSIPKGDRL